MLSFMSVTFRVAVSVQLAAEAVGLLEVAVVVGELLAAGLLLALVLLLLQPASANAAATATTLTCRVFTPSSC
jgi:hypothetical protein